LARPIEYVPEQGHIVLVQFNPQAGHEQAGWRPALILSQKSYNEKVGLCVGCPITNQVKGYPFEVALPRGLQVTGAVLSDQIKSFDWRARETEFVCDVPIDVVADVLARLNAIFN
jgi:mRNA interferase MazF